MKLISLKRRGKYILAEFPNGTLIIHLGMSGHLSIVPKGREIKKHDHIDIVFDNVGHKSFDVLLKGNKKITFYRIQESPELLILRKDENLLYHFPGDLGFTMLNPNVSKKEEK